MKIKKLHLKNIGRHHNLVFDCDAPVVGLIGANGSGKTTILESVSIGLTGEGSDNLDTYISHGETKGSIVLDFTSHQDGQIVRELGKTNKRTLTWEGVPHTKAKDVDARMSEIMKADKDSVRQAIFIKQGKLQNMLFDTTANRTALFVDLVNLAYLSKHERAIDGKIKHLQTLVADLEPQRIALEQQVATAEAARDARQTELDGMPDRQEEIDAVVMRLSDWARMEELNAKLIEIRPQVREQRDALSKLGGKDVAEMTVQCDNLAATCRLLTANMQSIQQGIVELRERRGVQENLTKAEQTVAAIGQILASINRVKQQTVVTECQTALRRFDEWGRIKVTLANTTARHKMTTTLLAGLKAPAVSREVLNAETEVLSSQGFRLKQLTEWLAFREGIKGCIGADGQCPECGLKVSHPEEVSECEIQKLRLAIQQEQLAYTAAVAANSAAVKICQTYENQFAQLSRAATDLSDTLKQLLAEGEALADVTDLDVDATKAKEKEAQEQLITLQANEIAFRSAISNKARHEASLNMLPIRDPAQFNDDTFLQAKSQADLAYRIHADALALKDRLVKVTADLNNIAKTEQDLVAQQLELSLKMSTEGDFEDADHRTVKTTDELSVYLATLRYEQEARSQKTGEVTQATLNVNTVGAVLQDLMERIAKDVKVAKCIQSLQGIKTVLSELPEQYVNYKFEQIAEVTQRYLSELTTSFAVSVDPTKPLSFQFTRCDEEKFFNLPQSKLSGGQRVRLSLAFLLAVGEILVPEVGLLVLDEPTLSLDEEGVESLAQFLTELNTKLENTDYQVWVVDHHPALMPCFRKCLILK